MIKDAIALRRAIAAPFAVRWAGHRSFGCCLESGVVRGEKSAAAETGIGAARQGHRPKRGHDPDGMLMMADTRK